MKKFISALTFVALATISVNAQHHTHHHDHICPECGGIYHVYNPHIVKYSGNVSFGAGALIEANYDCIGWEDLKPVALSLTTEHGIDITKSTWSSSVFVGVGTGLQLFYQYRKEDDIQYRWGKRSECDRYGEVTKTSQLFLPVYGTVRINFNKNGNVNPFIKFNEGGLFGLYEYYAQYNDFQCSTGKHYDDINYKGRYKEYENGYMAVNGMLSGFETGVSFKLNKKYAMSVAASYNIYTGFDDGVYIMGHQVQGTVRFEF